MAISTEESNRMIVEATMGKEKTSVRGEEAARYYEGLKAEIRDMLKKGAMPQPHAD